MLKGKVLTMKICFKRKSFAFCFAVLVYFIRVNSAVTHADAALDEGRYLIGNYYVEDTPDSIFLKDNLSDMVKELKDPYSTYLTADQYKDFDNSVNNKFSGIGVNIEVVSEGVKILSVMDNSPAIEAQLKAGDIITEADGHPLAGLSSEVAVKYIRGEEGTFVGLKLKRGQDIILKRVERRAISMPTVVSKVLDKHIGYIALNSFGENTPEEFKSHLYKLIETKVDSFIVDLRYNPGGYTSAAFDISGYFIGSNPALMIETRDGLKEYKNAIGHDYIIDKPVIFLINEYSASSSEILAAAVKDYKKALFIGGNTYGKGVAQSIFELSDGSYLKLTVYKFYSPKGKEINKVGVKPDLEVKGEGDKTQDPLLMGRILMDGSPKNVYKLGAIRAGIGVGKWEN
jgi:carboxyl-terminal processing protease